MLPALRLLARVGARLQFGWWEVVVCNLRVGDDRIELSSLLLRTWMMIVMMHRGNIFVIVKWKCKVWKEVVCCWRLCWRHLP